ncbi:hypothetical protein PVAP13_9NG570400 [Panicum virgatum]|uniref:Uncharacterized protein n=1 Tax=Panicum virgatum TaxID=38727 RepID=A0A8T0MYW3_PANVG|nr:hypothetical protein PVAP13_9NG570400 [Panicum virgatum]
MLLAKPNRARDAPAAPLRGGIDGPDASGAPDRRPDAATISASRAWRTEAICSPPVGDEQSCRMRGTPWPAVPEAILRNHGWGRAFVGLRPKDLAPIGRKPRGSPQVLLLLSIAWPNAMECLVLDENEMLSCTPCLLLSCVLLDRKHVSFPEL